MKATIWPMRSCVGWGIKMPSRGYASRATVVRPIPTPIKVPFLGPVVFIGHSEGLVRGFAKIKETFAGASILSVHQLANGRWVSITTA